MKLSLANKGIEIWNTLTKDLKQIKLHFVFKREAKKNTFFILNLLRIRFVYRRNFKVPKTKKMQEFYFPKIKKLQVLYLDDSKACRDSTALELCLYEVFKTELESAFFLQRSHLSFEKSEI